MEEIFTRLWNDLIGRIGGPMSFRLLLQPAMAMGKKDFQAGLKQGRQARQASTKGQLIADTAAIGQPFDPALMPPLLHPAHR